MNDDIEVITSDWLEKLVIRVQLEGIGVAGPMLYYPNNTIQHAGVILGIGGVAGHSFSGAAKDSIGYFGRAALEQDLSCVTAACMVVRRSAFDQLEGFNEDFAVAFNDVDFCIRIRQAGWRIVWTPQVTMYHHESASLGKHNSPSRRFLFDRETALMKELWGRLLEEDPFYNPNLSLATQQFKFSYPPRISKLPIFTQNISCEHRQSPAPTQF
jgi:GT2 family glycosyltransferase